MCFSCAGIFLQKNTALFTSLACKRTVLACGRSRCLRTRMWVIASQQLVSVGHIGLGVTCLSCPHLHCSPSKGLGYSRHAPKWALTLVIVTSAVRRGKSPPSLTVMLATYWQCTALYTSRIRNHYSWLYST